MVTKSVTTKICHCHHHWRKNEFNLTNSSKLLLKNIASTLNTNCIKVSNTCDPHFHIFIGEEICFWQKCWQRKKWLPCNNSLLAGWNQLFVSKHSAIDINTKHISAQIIERNTVQPIILEIFPSAIKWYRNGIRRINNNLQKYMKKKSREHTERKNHQKFAHTWSEAIFRAWISTSFFGSTWWAMNVIVNCFDGLFFRLTISHLWKWAILFVVFLPMIHKI